MMSDTQSLDQNEDEITGYEVIGSSRAMMANRLSYYFDFKGPSYTIDTACSSGLEALCNAVAAIMGGRCDAALVGSTNIILDPHASRSINILEMLSPDGTCKSFDKSGDGYCRSEGVVSLFVQNVSQAKRIYLHIVDILDSSDGFKKEGVTFPSGESQSRLLISVYEKARVNPAEVSYIEAHGTGTKAGDPQEVNAITRVLCKNRKTPLLMGSVKSNIGHTEATAGLASLAKVILASYYGILPPNLHFNTPNPDIPALLDGTIKVVNEAVIWEEELVAVSSYGFGGSNVHGIFKRPTTGTKQQIPSNMKLFLNSGRTQEWVKNIMKLIKENGPNTDLMSMVMSHINLPIKSHPSRGFMLMKDMIYEIKVCDYEKRPVWFIFPGMGSQWHRMGSDLFEAIPLFRNSILQCHKTLTKRGMDLIGLLKSASANVYADPLNAFVAICAIQIGLVDVLKSYGIHPDGMVGHSLGELACAYADETLTLAQTILTAYMRGKCVKSANLPRGSMAVVEMTWEEIKQICSDTVTPACHNGIRSVTISGPVEAIKAKVASLKKEGVRTTEIDSSGVAFHSPMLKICEGPFTTELKQIIPHPKQRSEKWISSSVPKEKWDTSLAIHSSPEYHVNNFLSPVLFHEALQEIPSNAICIEVGPHGLFQGTLMKAIGPDCSVVSMMKKNMDDGVSFFQKAIGRCYINGIDIEIDTLEFPTCNTKVSKGTPMISPCLAWNHAQNWHVPTPKSTQSPEQVTIIDTSKESFLLDHNINGRILYPAAGYIVLAWKSYANILGTDYEKVHIVIEDFKILKGSIVPRNGKLKYTTILTPTGYFEILEDGAVLAQGFIHRGVENSKDHRKDFQSYSNKPFQECHDIDILRTDDIYQALRIKGYDYGSAFQCLVVCKMRESIGLVKFEGNWITAIDSMFHLALVHDYSDEFKIPVGFSSIEINPSCISKDTEFEVVFKKDGSRFKSPGIYIAGFEDRVIPAHEPHQSATCLAYGFTEYFPPESACESVRTKTNVTSFEKCCFEKTFQFFIDTVLENLETSSIKILLIAKEVSEILKIDVDKLRFLPANNVLLEITVVVQNRPDDTDTDSLKALHVNVIEFDAMDYKFHQIICNTDFCIVLSDMTDRLDFVGKKLPRHAFIFVIEDNDMDMDRKAEPWSMMSSYICVAKHICCIIDMWLFKKAVTDYHNTIVRIEEDPDYLWVEELKSQINVARHDANTKIWVVSDGIYTSGILGLIKCLLMEMGKKTIRCLFNADSTPFDMDTANELFEKDLLINVMQNETWGRYQHRPKFFALPEIKVSRAIVNIGSSGNLSTLQWVGTHGSSDLDKSEIEVHYATIDKEDTLRATAKLSSSLTAGTTDFTHSCFGQEFAGIDKHGHKKMGIANKKCLATHVNNYVHCTWDVPAQWNINEAAGVPLAYATACYALQIRTKIPPKSSVLLNSAASCLGQAFVYILRSFGCSILTTCQQETDRHFYINTIGIHPDLIVKNVQYNECLMEITQNRGVDVIINIDSSSLPPDGLVNALAIDGQYINLVQEDEHSASLVKRLSMRNGTYIAIFMAQLLENPQNPVWVEIHKVVNKHLISGVIKPLPIIEMHNGALEKAFSLALESRSQRVCLKIKESKRPATVKVPKNRPVTSVKRPAVQKTYFDNNKVYLVTGGLGGLGLEMCCWMVDRGVRKLILTSRSGIKTGYQNWKLDHFKDKGCHVVISKLDVSYYDQAERLLEDAHQLGPIGGVFHLAAIVQDKLFKEQTVESFQSVCKVKVTGIKHLDDLTRAKYSRELDWFICFSSFASGFGNAGQSNYAFANSVMDRVVEKRHADTVPGISKSFQWGLMGDVGIVQRTLGGNSHFNMGTVPQRTKSFLQTLDLFLQTDGVIFSSTVHAEKSKVQSNKSLVMTILSILGIKTSDNLSDATLLSELGADSNMKAEIQHVLHQEFGIPLNMAEIEELSVAKLKNMEKMKHDVSEN